MKMLRYVFIISEIEPNRGWCNFQVIITCLINSKSSVNTATKENFILYLLMSRQVISGINRECWIFKSRFEFICNQGYLPM